MAFSKRYTPESTEIEIDVIQNGNGVSSSLLNNDNHVEATPIGVPGVEDINVNGSYRKTSSNNICTQTS